MSHETNEQQPVSLVLSIYCFTRSGMVSTL